ncbi:hypothetical protein HDV01_005873 [Terramyces sp. JEL0728]|nr:hypothetical protein HDV01_005873 [Terramyces sp. JEL0728]
MYKKEQKISPIKTEIAVKNSQILTPQTYSGNEQIEMAKFHINTPSSGSNITPVSSKTPINANDNLMDHLDLNYTWKCVKCGTLEKDTPLKRKGPDGTRSYCNACYVRWRVKSEKAERGSAIPNVRVTKQTQKKSISTMYTSLARMNPSTLNNGWGNFLFSTNHLLNPLQTSNMLASAIKNEKPEAMNPMQDIQPQEQHRTSLNYIKDKNRVSKKKQ